MATAKRRRRPMTAAAKKQTSAWCKTFRHELDGHVYVETSNNTGRKVWVARLQCLRCGTERIDFMVPETCELLSRRYFHPDDYATDMDRETAKQEVMRSMLTDPEEVPT